MAACPAGRRLNGLASLRPARSDGEAASVKPATLLPNSRVEIAGRIEAHAPFILNAVDTKSDITLGELRDKLKNYGATASIASLWRFFSNAVASPHDVIRSLC